MSDPAGASFWRMAKGMSIAASVSWKISRASCFRSDTFERANAGLCNVHVLVLGAVADADCANANAIHEQWKAAAHRYLASLRGQGKSNREHHVDLISRTCRRGREPPNRCSLRLMNGDLHGGKFRAVHAHKGQQVCAVIDHGDIQRNLDLHGARLRRG